MKFYSELIIYRMKMGGGQIEKSAERVSGAKIYKHTVWKGNEQSGDGDGDSAKSVFFAPHSHSISFPSRTVCLSQQFCYHLPHATWDQRIQPVTHVCILSKFVRERNKFIQTQTQTHNIQALEMERQCTLAKHPSNSRPFNSNYDVGKWQKVGNVII